MDYPFIERKCAVCGKNFVPAVEHVFKESAHGRIKWFCGYNCNCKFDRAHPKKKGSRWHRNESKLEEDA